MTATELSADDPIRAAIVAGMARWHDTHGRSVDDVLLEVFEERGIIVPDAPLERRAAVIVDAIAKYRPEDQSDYIVLPRSILSSMPHKWQDGLVDLLVDLDRTHNPKTLADRYVVQAVRSVTISDLDDDERDFYGFEPADDGIHFVDRDGKLLAVDARVEIPVEDPSAAADLGDPELHEAIEVPSAPHATSLVTPVPNVSAEAIDWFAGSMSPAPVELSPEEADAFAELERTLSHPPGRAE
ncbi:hypothetical protein GCM10025867_48070 (plasmid) [Frondihabitans sucicola]|uniref:Uncharacterized protein n=1 Tax=Frondihabitans sucicola TaxID=1268041 RepID=A0ABM8GVR7_9MICO|nr:hypothetical protein [Frondihabitans sucicola]BDZ52566.1 hypothetical protein GCM10025867_48070 [Frondihabitans sucicola]